MEMHSSYKSSEDHVAHLLYDCLISHIKMTLWQAMMFMSDDAQNKFVDEISEQRDKIQGARMKDQTIELNEGG